MRQIKSVREPIQVTHLKIGLSVQTQTASITNQTSQEDENFQGPSNSLSDVSV